MAPLTEKNTHSRHYTIEQLLGLRTSLLIINCVVENINKHPDIAAIFRLPEQALRHPRSYSCLTKTLATIKYEKPISIERRAAESSDDSGYHSLSKSSTRSIRDQNNSWHLRLRPSLDPRRTFDNQSQPHSAPANVASHQAENFRRFYRAVVSPTHVRVTAGGRIVPNTRATAPPMFDPMAEKYSSDSSKPSDEHGKIYRAKQTSEGGSERLQSISLGEGTTLPAGFPPVFHSPFLPTYNYLPQGNSLGLATMGHPAHNQFPQQSNSTVSGSSNTPTTQPIRISPPNQFDQSRPYLVYNNQVFFPAPAPPAANGFPAHPNMLGNQPFAAPMVGGPSGHFMPPGMLPMPMPMHVPNFPPPLMHHTNGQPLPMMMPPPPPQHGQFPPVMPLHSSQIEHHLQYLRSNLTSLDDHIASQSLQDDSFTSNQRQALTGEIARLTTLLNTTQIQHRTTQGNKPQSAGPKKPESRTSLVEEDNQSPVSTVVGNTMNTNNQKLSTYANSMSYTTTTQNVDSATVQHNPSSQGFSTPIVGTRLPATAAMAPPFQPRSQAPLTANQMDLFAMKSPGRTSPPATPESQLERQHRLLSRAETRWEDSAIGTSLVSMPRAQTMYVPQTQQAAPSFQRSETCPSSSAKLASMAQANFAPNSNFPVPAHTVPYLRGYPREGIISHGKVTTEFVYVRPLTEVENLARLEYWGKRPKHTSTRGLPRFDGQNFYLPLPDGGGSAVSSPRGVATEPPSFQAHCKELFGPTPTSSPMRATTSTSALRGGSKRVALNSSSFNDPALASPATKTYDGFLGNDAVQSRRQLSEPVLSAGDEFFENIFTEPGAPEPVYGPQSPNVQQHLVDESTTIKVSSDQTIEDDTIDTTHNFTLATDDDLLQAPDELPSPDFTGVFTDSAWGDVPSSNEIASRQDLDIRSTSQVNFPPTTPVSKPDDVPSKEIVTPENRVEVNDRQDDEIRSLEQWKLPTENEASTGSRSGIKQDILTPTTQDGSPQRRTFAQRVASTSSTGEQKSQLLQTMLKCHVATHASVAAPAYVSSDNVHGILPPQNRGSAAASLAPAMVNVGATTRESGSSKYSPRGFDYPVTPENRSRIRYDPSMHRSPESLAAEDYAKYLRGRG